VRLSTAGRIELRSIENDSVVEGSLDGRFELQDGVVVEVQLLGHTV